MTDIPSQASHKDQQDISLADLRDQIDAIDNAMLALLAKRQNLSRLVVTKKAKGSNVFRPDREVSLLRNLVASHPDIDARLIIGLWRFIISASIAEQKADYTIAHTPDATPLARAHGAGFMQNAVHESVEKAVASLQEGQADCIIVTQEEMERQAHLLHPDGPVIAASIGFLWQQTEKRGYILCRELPLASGDDVLVARDNQARLNHYDNEADMPASDELVGRYARPLRLSE